MEQDRKASISAGFTDHLTKPIDLNKLHNVVETLTVGA